MYIKLSEMLRLGIQDLEVEISCHRGLERLIYQTEGHDQEVEKVGEMVCDLDPGKSLVQGVHILEAESFHDLEVALGVLEVLEGVDQR